MVFKVYIFLLFLCFSFLKSLKAEQVLYLEDNFFPEGITISENGDIYVGSLKENKIVKFSNGKKDFEEFIPSESNNLLSVIGILADDRNKALWACSSNPGVTNYPSENPVTSLKVFDLITGNPLGSYELPNGGFCNDIAKDSKDNIYITDSFNPRILRLNKSKGRLEIWFENDSFKGEGFNLNGITFMDNHIYTVKMNSGELFKIKVKENGAPSNFSKITLPRPLNAPDGIKTIDKNNLLVVENKGSLSIIKLSDPTEITVIRDNLDTPTTVAIKKDTAWVLEAQFGHLFGEEKNVPPGKFKIVGVKLKTSLLTRLKSLLNISN